MQLRQSIEGVMDILSEANVSQDLSDIIEAYLLAQDRWRKKQVSNYTSFKHTLSTVRCRPLMYGFSHVFVRTTYMRNPRISSRH